MPANPAPGKSGLGHPVQLPAPGLSGPASARSRGDIGDARSIGGRVGFCF
ncbi:hypothetical protein ACFOD9_06960 [Novosphingobium bradum]|uniref:Uncharacterized protein n=1 Tax=Novosphingobium bradum TaxID=1737444 RepID=A0ABV7ISU3_9SPHN